MAALESENHRLADERVREMKKKKKKKRERQRERERERIHRPSGICVDKLRGLHPQLM
jgi:hypothetical protein